MQTVDVHTHFVPPDLVRAARSGDGFDGVRVERVNGDEWLVHRQGYRYPLDPAFYDPAARLSAMNALDVDVAVVSVAPTLFMYWADSSGATDFARRANDELAAFAAQSDGRIRTMATLPMHDPDAAVRELHRAVGELGMRGAEIGPAIEELPLDDSRFRPVLAAAAELGVPLVLHPYYVGARASLADFYLTNLLGNPLESTVSAARLILSGALDVLPDLRIVLMHGGGFLPYQIGRLDHGHLVRPEARDCRYDPSAYLSRFWFDTLTHAQEPLRFLLRLVGAEHVVYGTDFPFDMGGGSPAAQLGDLQLDPDSDAAVRGRNADHVFGLDLKER